MASFKKIWQRPRLGLALGGGGARGLAHIGVLKVFEEHHIPVDMVAGTSIGAVVGATYALHPQTSRVENARSNSFTARNSKKAASISSKKRMPRKISLRKSQHT